MYNSKPTNMKAITLLLPAVFFIASFNNFQDEELKTFKHPKLNFFFKASGEWKNNPYHKDKMIYEMVSTEGDIHVILWYTGGTESTCEKYLLKMADMKGYRCDGPVTDVEGKGSIWTLKCLGTEYGQSIVNCLAALYYVEDYGEDAPERSQGKSYNAIHIAQVWCPEERYEENQAQIQEIIKSLVLERP
jgi:hypothetical protein